MYLGCLKEDISAESYLPRILFYINPSLLSLVIHKSTFYCWTAILNSWSETKLSPYDVELCSELTFHMHCPPAVSCLQWLWNTAVGTWLVGSPWLVASLQCIQNTVLKFIIFSWSCPLQDISGGFLPLLYEI